MTTAHITEEQLQNIIEWSGGKEVSIPKAQQVAMTNYLKEKGLIPQYKLERVFGHFQQKNRQIIQNTIDRKKLIPGKVLALVKTKAVSAEDIARVTKLSIEQGRKLMLDLLSYSLVTQVSRQNAVFHYLGSLKNYSVGRFKHVLVPWVSEEEFRKKPLQTLDLFVWRKTESGYRHALKMAGRELFLDYANGAAKIFADQNKESKCLPEQIKELFGITIRDIAFLETPTNVKEFQFEDAFRDFISVMVKKEDPNAHCTDEEEAVEEANVFPDILVTQKDKQVAIELKKAARGHLVDCSIKQFLKYVKVYDFTGILTFYNIPGVALHLGSKTYSGEEFMQALDDYYTKKTKEAKDERDLVGRVDLESQAFCDKVRATNIYLAYRLSHRVLSKFDFKGQTIQTIVDPSAFDIFNKKYKKKKDHKVLFFLGNKDLKELAKKYKEVKAFNQLSSYYEEKKE